MAQVAFYIKRPDAKTPQRVFALYHIRGKQVKIYTPISVRPQDWSTSSQRMKSSAINAAPINDKLSEIRRQIEEVAYRLQLNDELTPERLKAEVEKDTGGTRTAVRKNTLDQIDEWIAAAERKHRHQTIKNYRTFKGHFERFCTKKHISPSLLSINQEFIRDFAEYLIEDAKLLNTSRWSVLKTMKTFLGWAYEEGKTSNRIFEKIRKKDFHVIEPVIVRLTEEELQAITNLDLFDNPGLANARDLFLLQCNLGVRYSDLIKLTPENIDGDFVRLTTEKTRKAVSIPLLPDARRLIEQAQPPRPISNQKLNNYLKEIAKRAKVDTPVIIPEFRGTARKNITKPKYELIASHTAKRTFVSLMIAKGVPVETVMKITGNTRSTIDRYVALDDSDVSAQLQKAGGLI